MDVKLVNDKYEELVTDMMALIPDEKIDEIIYGSLSDARRDFNKIYSQWSIENKTLFSLLLNHIRNKLHIFRFRSNKIIKDEKISSFLDFILSCEWGLKKHFQFDYSKDIELSYEENKDGISSIEKLLIFIIINLSKLKECVSLLKKEALIKNVSLLKKISITLYYEKDNGNSSKYKQYLNLSKDENDVIKVLKVLNKDFSYF